MRFNSERTSFGRHETFPLRFSWIPKGFQGVLADPNIFTSKDSTIALGVGKNMVSAIRYWLEAASLIERQGPTPITTPVGMTVFDEDTGFDPYLEDEGTIWLLHWLIASNAHHATAWYWFFNRFHKPEFTSQEVATALGDFVKNEVRGKVSQTTAKQDAAVLLRMYVQSNLGARTPVEEALDSPLSLLGLISGVPGSKRFLSRPSARPSLPVGIFSYALNEYLKATKSFEVPIEELMYGRMGYPAIGGLFRLTESALVGKLEEAIRTFPGLFELRETAGIHQLYLLETCSSLHFLDHHYSLESRKMVA